MNNLFEIFKIKESHFVDGWASFDAMTYQDLIPAIKSSKDLCWSNFKIINILTNYPELMCFGEVSLDGDIRIEGICGFPSSESCVKYLRDVADSANKKKITENYVYIEW